MPEERPSASAAVVTRRRSGISAVWLIPILAALAGVWVAITRIESEGPHLTLVLHSAEGLEAGKTKVRYKGVDVGAITALRLSEDHRQVLATVQMAPRTQDFLVEDTQFWVVRPRISGANVTGLGTLISGAYIGMDIGTSRKPRRDFMALEAPPVISEDTAGRFFLLKTSDLGSLDSGTPLFFRRLQVGQVASYSLDPDGRHFSVRVFVRAPYDRFVTNDTRFWQASGVDMQLSAAGLSIQTQSLLSILIGGIAFESLGPPTANPAPAPAETVFTLYTSRAQAFEPPPKNPQTYQLIFNESVRGLNAGAPVELRGIKIGQVADVRARFNARTAQFTTPVTILLDAQRLGVRVQDLSPGANVAQLRRRFVDTLVAHGVRAQLRSANLLTGAAMVSFDFFPNAPPARVDWSQNPPLLPTIPGQLEATEAAVSDILMKVRKLPLQQIGDNLQKSLADLDLTLVAARGTLEGAGTTLHSANDLIGSNSQQMQQLDRTLDELRRTARSIRELTDYLEQHPEALLRGKSGKPQ